MAWSQLDITKPHLVYIILGGFTSLFMLCSTVIKERMYIGEATVATLCGVIFGPHVANLINPNEWGNKDIVTLEFSRLVLVVQCFAVGVELPRFYMEKHWRSVVFLLVPVMTAGWLLTSLFIWWMVPPLNWLDGLVVAACVTATDPVLASSVVGKGKFAKRVPKHLRDLLSAESGCNDGMAFPFIYLSLYLIQYNRNAREVSFHFVVYVVLYECIFGAVYGFLIGYIARHGIKYAHQRELIDRESFLVFYFVIALFCAGSGSILGVDDLLVGFSAGVGFSNDGWFGEKTEESHVSNVIDLLLNLAYFVYFGTIIPWAQYNNGVEGLRAWRLVVIAIFVLLFRRIPIMMALKPLIPDVKNWREALFAGHFGPIGVGAIFVAILARAELEHEEPVPLSAVPPENHPHFSLLYLVWPIVTFLVLSSILIHGSSIAVFTLGKRINTLTLTMSYTVAPDEGPSWMNRLPRISSQSKSQAKTMSETSMDDYEKPEFPPGTLAPLGPFLRRQREEDTASRPNSRASSLVSRRRRHRKWDDAPGPGGPVSQSAIFPSRASPHPMSPTSPLSDKEPSPPERETTESTLAEESPKEKDMRRTETGDRLRAEHGEERRASGSPVEVFEEGHHLIFENEEGDVIDQEEAPGEQEQQEPTKPRPALTRMRSKSLGDPSAWKLGGIRRKVSDMYNVELEKRKDKDRSTRRHEPARAYQFGNTIIVEDEDGEVVKTYELPSAKAEQQEGGAPLGHTLKYFGLGGLARTPAEKPLEKVAEEGEASGEPAPGKLQPRSTWGGLGMLAGSSQAQRAEQARRKSVAQEEAAADDRKIRFTIGGVGQRMTKEDFIREVQKLDTGTRKDVVDHSSASTALKKLAKEEPATAAEAMAEVSQQPPIPRIVEHGSRSSSSDVSPGPRRKTGKTPSRPQPPPVSKAEASSSQSSSSHEAQPSEQLVETAVERKRRLAALAGQADDEETGETPAERRRREAALGMGESSRVEDSDSDDEGEPRVPPARRGIRFAEPDRGRR